MDMSSRLHLTKLDFTKLLNFLTAKCSDLEASKFFDYLLHYKVALYSKLYPHLQLKVAS